MKYVKYKRNIDAFSWRCMNKTCQNYKKYFSIRKDSFFEHFNIDLKSILKVLLKYSCRQPIHSIRLALNLSRCSILRIIDKLCNKMPIPDFYENKLGGPNCRVEIDETMLNFKIKSHRGRAPQNRTDSLCIVECNPNITRVFATIIPNKKSTTIIPIIVRQVAANTKIWTDEHGAYNNLGALGFEHQTVCHKYEFITSEGVNTQSVESFNNTLKYEIKLRKGVKTDAREEFLKEFCFYYNNRNNFFLTVFNLIKI